MYFYVLIQMVIPDEKDDADDDVGLYFHLGPRCALLYRLEIVQIKLRDISDGKNSARW